MHRADPQPGRVSGWVGEWVGGFGSVRTRVRARARAAPVWISSSTRERRISHGGDADHTHTHTHTHSAQLSTTSSGVRCCGSGSCLIPPDLSRRRRVTCCSSSSWCVWCHAPPGLTQARRAPGPKAVVGQRGRPGVRPTHQRARRRRATARRTVSQGKPHFDKHRHHSAFGRIHRNASQRGSNPLHKENRPSEFFLGPAQKKL